MPTSATGNKRGFTLVETLVVLVIVGLLAGVVTLTLPKRPANAREDARTLAARATLAAQESILTRAPIGLTLTAQGYSFSQWRDGRWTSLADAKTFTPRLWSERVRVSLSEFKLPPSAKTRANAAALPTVVFQSTGRATPFKVTFLQDRESWTVTGNERGDIALAPVTP